jgi:hypothetical protein
MIKLNLSHVVVITVIIFCLMINMHRSEHLNNIPTEKVQSGSTLSFLTDPQFSDVKVYENDDNYENDINNNIIQKLGIEKCMEDKNCETCVEFGITGKAFCYPKRS